MRYILADIAALIKMGYSVSERDGEQRTARDVAENAGMTENVEAIGLYSYCLFVFC
jgi:hypothetical protein